MSTVAIRALIRNDLRLYLTDRRALVIGVIVPIFIAAFFGYVFGGNGGAEAPGAIPIGLVDEDQSAVSRAITADLASESMLDVRTLDRSAAEERVRSGKVQVAAIIPKNFGAASMQALFSGLAKPRIELLIDPSKSISGRVVEGLFAQHGMREITKQAFGGASAQAVPPGLQYGFSIPYGVAMTKVTSARNVPYNGYAHSFAGMTTQFILFAGIDAGILLLLVRERGVWQRLRSAPIGKTEFLLARTVATVLISLFQFMLIYTAAIVIFGVRIGGSVIGFGALAVALCLLNATFGLMLASIGRSAAATRGIAVMATLLLVMVGGAWVPSFVFPTWLQRVSLAAPTRWAVDGLDAVSWRGLGFAAAVTPIIVLGMTAIVCLAIAIWQFRWED